MKFTKDYQSYNLTNKLAFSLLLLRVFSSELIATTNVEVPSGASYEISGQISGPGGINKIGDGTLTLSAQNNFTGNSVVSAGTLLITGTTPGNITVSSGASLGGGGTVGGGVTSSGTVIADYGSSNVLNTGLYTQNSSANLAITVAPTVYDHLNVTGSAILDGNLSVYVEPGSYDSTVVVTYPILQTTGGLPEHLPPTPSTSISLSSKAMSS